MIVLWQFKPAFRQPHPGPFGLKVETRLRRNGLAYDATAYAFLAHLRQPPLEPP